MLLYFSCVVYGKIRISDVFGVYRIGVAHFQKDP